MAEANNGDLKVSPKKLLITSLRPSTRNERKKGRKRERERKREKKYYEGERPEKLGRHIASPFRVRPPVLQRRVITGFMDGGIYKESQKSKENEEGKEGA